MFRAIGRFLVATAAGAGLGAGAALYRRHLIELEPADGQWPEAPVLPEDFAPPPSREAVTQPAEPPTHREPAPASVAAPTQPTAEDLAALQASVADLEAARARLRERAAALRAEMEGEGR